MLYLYKIHKVIFENRILCSQAFLLKIWRAFLCSVGRVTDPDGVDSDSKVLNNGLLNNARKVRFRGNLNLVVQPGSKLDPFSN